MAYVVASSVELPPASCSVSASSLLLVIGEAWSDQHRQLILERLGKGRRGAVVKQSKAYRKVFDEGA